MILAGGLTAGTLLGLTTSKGAMGAEGVSEIGTTRGFSVQDLLARSGMTAIDSERRLYYLSLNPSRGFTAIPSSSLFGLWMMWGTIGSTSMSGSTPEKFKSAFEFGIMLVMEAGSRCKGSQSRRRHGCRSRRLLSSLSSELLFS